MSAWGGLADTQACAPVLGRVVAPGRLVSQGGFTWWRATPQAQWVACTSTCSGHHRTRLMGLSAGLFCLDEGLALPCSPWQEIGEGVMGRVWHAGEDTHASIGGRWKLHGSSQHP